MLHERLQVSCGSRRALGLATAWHPGGRDLGMGIWWFTSASWMAAFPEAKEWGSRHWSGWFLSFDFSFPDFWQYEDGRLRSGEEFGKKGSPKELFASFIWLLLHSSQKEHGLLRVGDWVSPGFSFNYIPEKNVLLFDDDLDQQGVPSSSNIMCSFTSLETSILL